LQLDFDGKRDPYGGYDPVTYHLVIRDFELLDQERKRRKVLELQEKSITPKAFSVSNPGSGQNDNKYVSFIINILILLISKLSFKVVNFPFTFTKNV
jgi:hypothetical protein